MKRKWDKTEEGQNAPLFSILSEFLLIKSHYKMRIHAQLSRMFNESNRSSFPYKRYITPFYHSYVLLYILYLLSLLLLNHYNH